MFLILKSLCYQFSSLLFIFNKIDLLFFSYLLPFVVLASHLLRKWAEDAIELSCVSQT